MTWKDVGGSGIQTGDDATLGSLDLGLGSAGSPSLRFSDDNSGIYSAGGNILSFSMNGVERARWNTSTLSMITNIAFGSVATPDLYLRRSAASTLTVDSDGAGGAANLVVGGTGNFGSRLYINPSGTSALSISSAKALAFTSGADPSAGGQDTYLTRAEANVLRLDGDGSGSTGADLLLVDDGRMVYGAGSDWTEQGESTTLTDNTATTVFSITLADGDMKGGVISYVIRADDGSDYQCEAGVVEFALVDTSGGVVADLNETADTATAVSTGTLTSSWAAVTTDDQSIEIQVTANSSLTTPTMDIAWKVSGNNLTITVP